MYSSRANEQLNGQNSRPWNSVAAMKRTRARKKREEKSSFEKRRWIFGWMLKRGGVKAHHKCQNGAVRRRGRDLIMSWSSVSNIFKKLIFRKTLSKRGKLIKEPWNDFYWLGILRSMRVIYGLRKVIETSIWSLNIDFFLWFLVSWGRPIVSCGLQVEHNEEPVVQLDHCWPMTAIVGIICSLIKETNFQWRLPLVKQKFIKTCNMLKLSKKDAKPNVEHIPLHSKSLLALLIKNSNHSGRSIPSHSIFRFDLHASLNPPSERDDISIGCKKTPQAILVFVPQSLPNSQECKPSITIYKVQVVGPTWLDLSEEPNLLGEHIAYWPMSILRAYIWTDKKIFSGPIRA